MLGQNAAATGVDSALHDIVFGVAIRAARADAEVDFPWLKFPILSTLFSLGLNWFGARVYKPLAQTSTFGVIDVQVGREKSDCTSALLKLRQALTSGDLAAIGKATTDYENAFAAGAHDDGSATD